MAERAQKSLAGMLKALPTLARMEEARGFGKCFYRQWGGGRQMVKIPAGTLRSGDGLLTNLKNLGKSRMGRIVPHAIINMWTNFADREAIVDGEKRYTFGQLRERVFRLANAFQGLGVRPKDAVAVMTYNSAEFLEVFWACSFTGAPMPFVNWHLRGEELRTAINLRKPKILVFDADFLGEVQRIKEGLEGVEHLIIVGAEERPEGMLAYEEILRQYPDRPPEFNFLPALNPYTGGTTGIPKSSNFFDSFGFLLSDLAEAPRADLATFLRYSILAFSFLYWYGGAELKDEVSGNIRTLIVTPMYHAGTIVAWAPWMLLGATAVIMRQFDPEEFLRLIEAERVSWTFVAPTILQRVLALPEEVKGKYRLGSMRSLICAAAPCPPEVKREINELFMRQGAPGPVFNEYYGSAETAVVTILLPDDYRDHPKRIESVGKARGGDLAIYLEEEGRWATPGEVGRVMSRTAPTLSLRYPGSEERLHESIRIIDGKEWYDDGLLGYVDEDGFLYLTGRVKEMIICGGVNIFPLEIEEVILRHPAVFDVAVVRLPHPDLGEVPIACVQLHPGQEATEEEILAFCKEQGLYGYKVPARVEFFEELPRHIDGKIIKRELEERYWKGVERRG